MRRRQRELPAEVGEVGCQIERWRSGRERQSAMPAELWSAAAELAQRYGINPISQALRLSYDSLKKRMLALGGIGATKSSGSLGFVELDRGGIERSSEEGVVEVEVCDRDGERMKIRLKGRSDVDVTSMVAEFWRRGR